ncbi:sugar transferase [Spirosoma utsteinense]|uniref:Colanic acid biosynthesis UDP-glucose lipid carrier transferase n=1 Tax=Spirosoma utsteinense TaxID=2585773 RepID=A0ABR6WAI8_9BACT|nr:sugar transferase [Spirosoma utsteinense]MBC3783830.1 putative colanic acid biosynthesis UDP-glucose lipid carrier transferase [Spirosoma utsteinense]MBC3793591.1 putative colanic acid biosynthesis UDP-glucose lipid carrier transferase [Spirosoma utsteinense]
MRHRYSILFFPLHIIVDFLSLNAAFLGGYWIKFQTTETVSAPPYASLWWLFNAVWLVEILILKPYIYPRQLFKANHLLMNLLVLTTIHVAVISICWVAIKGYYYSREHLLITYTLFVSMAAAVRIGGLIFLQEYRARGYNNRRYIIVGYGKLADSIRSFYEAHPEMGFRFCGYFDRPSPENEGLLQGDYASLEPYITRESIDCIYCCMPYIDNDQMKVITDRAESMDYQVKLLVDFRGFMARGASVEYHDFLPVLNLSSQMLADFRVNTLKRAFDIVFSLGVLILGFPIFLILGLITRLTSSGPVLYAQERVGRDGKIFSIYKFRSMYTDAEKSGPVLSGGLLDSRITPWGRFMRQTRLDELPQFVNVLKGDMSVVGPRPERQYFIDKIVEIAPEYQSLLKVKPGITSIGQIKFGYAATIEEMVQRLRYDLLYPDRRSFLFDMWIIAQTLRVMAQGRGK